MKEAGVEYRYREYTREPLTVDELRGVLGMLGVGPKDVFRKNDAAARTLGLSGKEGDDELIMLMGAHPTLLQRPIGILGGRAIVGRPPERLLELVGG